MTAAAQYAARIAAVDAQSARLLGDAPTGDRWGGAMASRFRMDPHREPDANLAAIAAYVMPDDVFIDVGGGAGRVSLPLALRCREVVNVDPSPGMCAEFESCANEAGIANARVRQAGWPTEGIRGDVALAANVTYFVRDIVPFVRGLEAAARRRVMITVWSVPPPSQDAALFRLVWGEEQERAPGHQDLLPVLWDLGILPDVRVLPNPFRDAPLPSSRDEAIEWALTRIREGHRERVRATVEANFDTLFAPAGGRLRPLWRLDVREMIITWEPEASV